MEGPRQMRPGYPILFDKGGGTENGPYVHKRGSFMEDRL